MDTAFDFTLTNDTAITISVTDDDLAKGKVGDSTADAIALAARRMLPGCQVFTCPAILIVRPGNGWPDMWFVLPPEARALIDQLDNGDWESAEPLTFTAPMTKFVSKKKQAAAR